MQASEGEWRSYYIHLVRLAYRFIKGVPLRKCVDCSVPLYLRKTQVSFDKLEIKITVTMPNNDRFSCWNWLANIRSSLSTTSAISKTFFVIANSSLLKINRFVQNTIKYSSEWCDNVWAMSRHKASRCSRFTFVNQYFLYRQWFFTEKSNFFRQNSPEEFTWKWEYPKYNILPKWQFGVHNETISDKFSLK